MIAAIHLLLELLNSTCQPQMFDASIYEKYDDGLDNEEDNDKIENNQKAVEEAPSIEKSTNTNPEREKGATMSQVSHISFCLIFISMFVPKQPQLHFILEVLYLGSPPHPPSFFKKNK